MKILSTLLDPTSPPLISNSSGSTLGPLLMVFPKMRTVFRVKVFQSLSSHCPVWDEWCLQPQEGCVHEGWLIPFGEVKPHSSHAPGWALLDPVHALSSASFLKVAGNRTPSNHLILHRPPLLPPSIFPRIRVFSNESVLCIRWPKYWSFRLRISPFQWIFRTDFL